MNQTNTSMNDYTTTNAEIFGVTPVVLTVRQVAAKLQASRWTVYELIRKRQLPSFKIGRRRYVPRQAVHDLVAKLAAEAA